ncbi:hypothetical protein [Roseitranquillus sediminis]|uniref:hypothetical protein n=1 Tax=Roseitranquillus sediminis TaxID=2809051 RepID=UPI001D0C86BB|nr:hypothetical protein [Roseitranquillus sediminis]MBM9595429.1 hypothetical protein [Roseitranquillus sediminis]
MCDRRFIREELIADIMVFDLKGLREVGTFSYPHHLAEGVTYGMVNGELAIDDGAFTTCGAVASSRALARTCAKRVSGGAAAADPGAPGIGR